MGSANEPVSILHPDVPPTPANPVESIRLQHVGFSIVPMQTQEIRQHMSVGQIHLHCDSQKIKSAISVAEWYVIMRNLRSLNPFTWIDPENKCVVYFRPYINAGVFEVAIELAPINIGVRFNEMNLVTGKR